MSPLVTSLLLALALGFFCYTMFWRMRAMLSLKPDTSRFNRIPERIDALMKFGFGQKRMVDPEEFTPGVMHVAIFAAFLIVQLRTLMMFVMGFSTTAIAVLGNLDHSFWVEHSALATAYSGYLVLKDVAAGLAVIGVVYFMFLRLVVKPDRLTRSKEAMLILGFIGA